MAVDSAPHLVSSIMQTLDVFRTTVVHALTALGLKSGVIGVVATSIMPIITSGLVPPPEGLRRWAPVMDVGTYKTLLIQTWATLM